MANVRIYQPPVDPSSVAIEAQIQADGSARQVTRAPDLEAIVLKRSDLAISGGGNLYVSDTFALKISQGKARFGGATVITTLTNPNATFTAENPATNTRNVFVVGFDVYSSTNATVQYMTNYTPANPSVGTLFNPNRAYSAPTAAIVSAGNIDPTGATTQPLASVVTANSPLKLQQFVILPPGQVIGIKVTGAANGSNITSNLFLFEE